MADKRIDQLVAATTVGDNDLLVLEQNNQAKKLTGKALGDYVYAAAAEKVAEVEEAVAQSQAAIDSLEEQKDEIAQAIASMAQYGTDTTLTTPGIAADAEATGDRIKELEDEALGHYEQKTIDGVAIASFDDGADNVPVKALTVGIDPVQDLNGYDNPWPAGGGKNKCDPSQRSVTSGTIKFFESAGFQIHNGETWTFSVSVTAAQLTIKNHSGGSNLIVNYGKTSITYMAIADIMIELEAFYNTTYPLPSGGADGINFQLELGSSATTFAPYSNICPITGHTGANVVRTGKNLLPYALSYFTSAVSDSYNPNTCFFLKTGTYKFSFADFVNATSWRFGIVVFDKTKNRYFDANVLFGDFRPNTSGSYYVLVDNSTAKELTLTMQIDGYIHLFFLLGNTSASSSVINPQLELGSTTTDYEPYSGTTYEVTFPSEAGTVYGGTLINEGTETWKLKVDHAEVDLGSLTWRYNYASLLGFDSTGIASVVAGGNNAICSCYRNLNDIMVSGNISSNDVFFRINKSASGTTESGSFSLGEVFIKDTHYTTVEGFVSAMTGQKLVYELATPIEYTLTAAQVKTLLAQNNIWADTGNINQLIYRALNDSSTIKEYIDDQIDSLHDIVDGELDDLQLTLESMISGVEESMTATQNYPVDALFIAFGTLYKATSAIANGETIEPTVNCEVTTIEEQLNALKETKADIDGHYEMLNAGLADNLVATVGIEDKVPYNFRTSGGSADIGDYEEDTIVGGTIAWNQLVTTDTNVSKTKSGSVVSVSDAVAENAQELVVNIEPQQDLHGYDYPWLGGSRKNKLPFLANNSATFNGVTISYDNAKEAYILNGTLTTAGNILLESIPMAQLPIQADMTSGTRILSVSVVSGDFTLGEGTGITYALALFESSSSNYIRDGNTSHSASEFDGSYGTRVSGLTSTGDYKLYLQCWRQGTVFNNLKFRVQLEESSSTPARPSEWTPYENICPITGHTGVNMYDDPKYGGLINWNQIADMVSTTGTHRFEGWASTVTYNVDGSVTITTTRDFTEVGVGVTTAVTYTLGHKYYIGLLLKNSDVTPTKVNFSFTSSWSTACTSLANNFSDYGWYTGITECVVAGDSTQPQRINIRVVGSFTDGDSFTIDGIIFSDLTQMFGAGNEPSTAAEFEALFPKDYYAYNTGEETTVSAVNDDPYRHIEIEFPDAADTVYGGTLDVTNGTLIVDRATYTCTGEENLIEWELYTSKENIAGRLPLTAAKGLYEDGKNNALCNILPSVTNVQMYLGTTDQGVCVSNGGYIAIQVDGITTLADLKTWLAANTPQIVYKLFTPITYTLTPQQVTMLLGENNIWADTGSTSLTYLGTTNEIKAQENHKYLTKINGTSTVVNGSGQTISAEKGRDNVFDLTQMLGSSIANHVYLLEGTTAGTGVAWFNHLFPKPYYSYNAGELMSVNTSVHKMVGFNAWDEQWELGLIDATTGQNTSNNSYCRSKNYIPIIRGAVYCFTPKAKTLYLRKYDVNKNYLGYQQRTGEGNHTLHFDDDVAFLRFCWDGNTYANDICINLSWDGERNGEYESYREYAYPLDASLNLRGIPKIDSNNELHYDGDIYESSGKVTRKYGVITLDGTQAIGSTNWRASATSVGWLYPYGLTNNKTYTTNTSAQNIISDVLGVGTYQAAYNMDLDNCVTTVTYGSGEPVYGLVVRVADPTLTTSTAINNYLSSHPITVVYELAETTTESADPFNSPQVIDDFGTEEYVDYAVSQNQREVAVPVGHDTFYAANLRAKLEMAPDSPDGDGDYIVRHFGGENTYVPLTIPDELPTMPTINGTYNLRLVVSNGTPTLSWVIV